MTINILFSASPEGWEKFRTPLEHTLSNLRLPFNLATEIAPDLVDYIIYAPNPDVIDFRAFTRCKAVLNLWAGVEDIAPNTTLTIPLARMVDHGLCHGMTEWVVGHVMRYHLGMDRHILGQDGLWDPHIPPLAEERIVTVLGLGELGSHCAGTLAMLGFEVRGWSRRAKEVKGVTCFAGEEGFKATLRGADFVVLLLPYTADTENTLNRNSLSLLNQGAFVINPGRGPLIDDDALLEALDNGQIAHATLDVFRNEPLPKDHPYWAHHRVTVTPHIAAATRPECAAPVIAENIRRGEAGEPFLHVVDRQKGY